jgi:hypothetical protein
LALSIPRYLEDSAARPAEVALPTRAVASW